MTCWREELDPSAEYKKYVYRKHVEASPPFGIRVQTPDKINVDLIGLQWCPAPKHSSLIRDVEYRFEGGLISYPNLGDIRAKEGRWSLFKPHPNFSISLFDDLYDRSPYLGPSLRRCLDVLEQYIGVLNELEEEKLTLQSIPGVRVKGIPI